MTTNHVHADLSGPWPYCPDCVAAIDQPHIDGCDVARCLRTGLQRTSCRYDHDCGKDIWTSRWPGEADCERLGWMIGPGLHDLYRLVTEATWNPTTQQWESP